MSSILVRATNFPLLGVCKGEAMLLCLVISGQLWIGDSQRLFPTQGDYYFHKFQDSITIYSVGGIRRGSVAIPKEMNGETIAEVFTNCSKTQE